MMTLDLDAAATAIVSWALTYAIHSTLLLAGAALAAWRWGDHPERLDPIWKVAVLAPLVTASLQLNAIALPLVDRATMPAPNPVAIDRSRAASITAVAAPSNEAITRKQAVPAPVDRAASAVTAPVTADGGPSWWPVATRWPFAVALPWLGTATLLVARYLTRLRRVYNILGAGSPVSAPELLAAVDELQQVAHRPQKIRLLTSAVCPVPVALAGARIVLPSRFLDELDAEQQRAALAHELAHVIRRDPGWRVAMDVIERIFFFQPLNRLARARLCDAAEFLCDRWAVGVTQSPLALARCLSTVAGWWTSAGHLPAGVSAMARSDSAMVRRVTCILDATSSIKPLRLYWLAIPVVLVALAAPRVTAAQLPAHIAVSPISPALGAFTSGPAAERGDEQRERQRDWTAAEIAAATAQLRVFRLDRSGATLDAKWQQAFADATRQGFNSFWIAYAIAAPGRAGNFIFADTRDNTYISANGHIVSQGPPLSEVINPSAVPLEGGNLVVLLHYRAARADAIDRAAYRSVQLGFDFGPTPVFWLGDAPDSQSFTRVETLFGQMRDRKLQVFMLELASMHADSNRVIPFLARLVQPSWPAEIRSEAAEGFEHHHDSRSVEILQRVARTDADSDVRAEAAETIGGVQTPQSIPALMDLATESPDPVVRGEAAEAFGSQPPAQALPAIERLIASSNHEEVLNEAIEAVGELDDPGALPLLVRIANTHPSRVAQQEAVETIGDLGEPAGAIDALTRIAWEHGDVEVQREAVETLGDRRDDEGAVAALERIAREHEREEVQAEAIETLMDGDKQALHPLILELALTGKSPRVRREALDAIGEAVAKIGDAQLLDRAQTVIERAVFEDTDRSVQADALDALDEFPSERALRVLRDVAARHADPRMRRDAEEHLRERQ